MMQMRVAAVVGLLVFFRAPALADQTTIGVTVNGTTGDHVEPTRTEAIPFLPLPMFELEHVHKNFHLHLEAVPPIGPVPLAQSDDSYNERSPRVSYLNGELLYASDIVPLQIGIGETVLNQRTLYGDGTPPQFSRVVGMRLIARAQVYDDGRHRLALNVAVNPAMQGFQNGTFAEHASLVDSSLRWSVNEGSYDFTYGVRYWNYTAAYYDDNSLADRNHLFMPFVGVAWHGKTTSATTDPPAHHDVVTQWKPPHSDHWTTAGVTLFGTNGNRTQTGAYSDTPLNFTLMPSFSLDHGFERYELLGEGILPNSGPNPFGAQQQTWNLLSIDGLVDLHDSRFAFGLGETVANMQPMHLEPFTTSHSRSEALDLVGRVRLTQSARGRVEARIRWNPDVHVSETASFDRPGTHSFSTSETARGARVDATISRTNDAPRFGFTYGLRYINQTTNYGKLYFGGALLTRSSSLMPFIGLTIKTR